MKDIQGPLEASLQNCQDHILFSRTLMDFKGRGHPAEGQPAYLTYPFTRQHIYSERDKPMLIYYHRLNVLHQPPVQLQTVSCC